MIVAIIQLPKLKMSWPTGSKNAKPLKGLCSIKLVPQTKKALSLVASCHPLPVKPVANTIISLV